MAGTSERTGLLRRKLVSRRRGEENVLATTWLGKEVTRKFFWLPCVQQRGDEKVYGCHVIREGDGETVLVTQ
jgi:hypothetical protein